MLFLIVIEEFAKVSSLAVNVQIIDKITRPFELLVERGNLDTDKNLFSETNGLWSQKLNDAVYIAARWLEAVPITSSFAFSDNFLEVSIFINIITIFFY